MIQCWQSITCFYTCLPISAAFPHVMSPHNSFTLFLWEPFLHPMLIIAVFITCNDIGDTFVRSQLRVPGRNQHGGGSAAGSWTTGLAATQLHYLNVWNRWERIEVLVLWTPCVCSVNLIVRSIH